eukprot:7377133-Prymnesium_polylepis.1
MLPILKHFPLIGAPKRPRQEIELDKDHRRALSDDVSDAVARVPSVTIGTLTASSTEFILIGEDHYTHGSKKEIADLLITLSTSGKVELHVEDLNDDSSDSADELARHAHLSTDRGPPPPNTNNSLLLRLREAPNARFFAPSPETLLGSVQTDTETALVLVQWAVRCSDPSLSPSSRATQAFTSAANLAENTLGSCWAVAKRLVEKDVIARELREIVKTYLATRMTTLRETIYPRVRLPFLNTLKDRYFTYQDSRFEKAVTECMFAKHVVSDAAFATRLHRDAHHVPVIVVSGEAHAETIHNMLAALNSPDIG